MSTNHCDNKKERVVAFLPPELIQKMSRLEGERQMKNHSEFIQSAVRFYIGFLTSADATEFLSATLQSALRENLLHMQDRVAANLFRLSVETDMIMHILAANLDIEPAELHGLRGRCVKEVKQTKGKILLNEAVRFQRGNDDWGMF